MTTENAAAGSAIHDRSHLHGSITDISGRPGTILVDKTVALILGAIGSAAIAAAFAGGIALIGKVAETGEQLEKGRTEQTQQYGNITKDVSIIETKISQLSVQIAQMETRFGRMIEHDFQNRDRRIDEINMELSRLREQIMNIAREDRYYPKSNADVNLFGTFAWFFRSSSQPKSNPRVSENGSRRYAAKEAPNENPSSRERRPRQSILTDESFEITVIGRSTESGGCLGRMNPPDQD